MTPITPMSAIFTISIILCELRKSIHSSEKGMVVTHIITMMINQFLIVFDANRIDATYWKLHR